MRAFDLSVSGSLYITGSIKTADGTFMLSGSTPDASSSFSTRTTNLETHSGTSKTLVSGSAQVKALLPTSTVSSSAQIAVDISGSFTTVSSSLASRLTTEEGEAEGSVISSSAQIATDISGSFTATSSSIATRFDSRETDMTLATASIASNESNMTLATASIAAITASVSTINSNMTLATASIAAITASLGQPVNTDSAVTFATVDTGQGANELYDMDQNVKTDSAVTFATVDTGQGANELYDMDQNVLTTSSPTFADLTATGTVTAQEFHTEFVSSSILYTSGSTRFGNSSDDIHQFTGSIHLVNSGSVSGSAYSTGSFGRVEGSTLQGTIVTPSQTNITSVGTIGTGTWEGTTVAVNQGGTGVTTSTGTTNVVLSNSPTLVTPALGTPASGNLANCTFPTLNQNTTGQAATVATITGLAPDTATTQATQASITSAANLATVGTIGTGVWNGDVIASAYLDSDTAHLTTDQTFSGKKTFSQAITGSHFSGSSTSTGSFGRVEAINFSGDGSGLSGITVPTAADISGSWQGVIGSGSLGMVSGSSVSTGSFGHVSVAGVLKTGDLELENKRGHWKIVEESEYLSITNVNTNKKYKILMEEIE